MKSIICHTRECVINYIPFWTVLLLLWTVLPLCFLLPFFHLFSSSFFAMADGQCNTDMSLCHNQSVDMSALEPTVLLHHAL